MRKKIMLEICEELLEQAYHLKLNLSELLETSIKSRISNSRTSTTTTTKPSTEPTSVTPYYYSSDEIEPDRNRKKR